LELAKLLFRTNRAAEAARLLERLVAAKPDVAQAHYQLGLVYGRLKRVADAKVAFANFKRLSDTQQQQSETERVEIVRRLADVRF